MNNQNITIKDLSEKGYFTHQSLVDVVNAAKYLNKKLLLEGQPGTGKKF